MRCLLEQADGVDAVGGSPRVNSLFGITGKDDAENIPSRLIVRDAMLTRDSLNLFAKSEYLDMPYTENKWENVIDRTKGVAEHPRQSERVPAGAKFNAEFILNIWDNDNEEELMALFMKGIRLLENDYLGGSGSRGYGQIKFGEFVKTEISDANEWKA